MLGATSIETLPFPLIPAHTGICRVTRLALLRKVLDVTPVLQLLALVICCLDGLEQVIDSAFFGVAFGLGIFLVLFAVVSGGFEAVHECGEELATRILEYKHRHDGRDLNMLVVFEMWGYNMHTCPAR